MITILALHITAVVHDLVLAAAGADSILTKGTSVMSDLKTFLLSAIGLAALAAFVRMTGFKPTLTILALAGVAAGIYIALGTLVSDGTMADWVRNLVQ